MRKPQNNVTFTPRPHRRRHADRSPPKPSCHQLLCQHNLLFCQTKKDILMIGKQARNRKSKKHSSAALARRATKTSAQHPKAGNERLPIRATSRDELRPRERAILSAASAAGYLRGEKTERIGGRVTRKLLSAAKERSGLTSQTELLEYALSMVALEDDYGATLLSMKGSIPDDVEL